MKDAKEPALRNRVSVVIPNRNGRQHLEYSLPSLSKTAYPSFSAMMVDNCSIDDSCAYVAAHFPWVTTIRMQEDEGFAGGVNTGIRLALEKGCEFVAVFSNDIKVIPQWLDAAIEVLERQEHAAVVGYTEFPRSHSAPLEMPSTVQAVDVGTALPGPLYVCRADVFARVGLYDERFFMYGEEADLFARVRRAGYRVLQMNVPVWHYGGGFTAQAPFRVAWLRQRNGMRHAIKNETPWLALGRTLALLYYTLHPSGRPLSARWRTLSPAALARGRVMRGQLCPSKNPLVNGAIWVAAVLWNLVFLPETLVSRWRDTRRLRRAPKKTDGPGSH